MCSYALDEPSCRQALLCCDRTKFSSARSASRWLLERSVRVPCRIFESTFFSGSTQCSLKKKENRNLARLDPSITDQLRVDKS